MSLPPLKAFSFDLVGTLIRVQGSVGAQYADLAARFGTHAVPTDIERAFPGALRSAPPLNTVGRSRGAGHSARSGLIRMTTLGELVGLFLGHPPHQ